MNLNFYSAKNYDNKSGLLMTAKQTQSNPTCSELACGELVEPVEPVEGVEPISNRAKSSWLKAKIADIIELLSE